GEMESSFSAFHRAVLVYADVLGEAGLAAYRQLAEAEWAKVPALKPGEDDPNRYGRRYRITSIMEAMALARLQRFGDLTRFNILISLYATFQGRHYEWLGQLVLAAPAVIRGGAWGGKDSFSCCRRIC
ncbi:MAG: hypothetical protein ACE5JZ_10960, partial [Kiloniellales bacterium]